MRSALFTLALLVAALIALLLWRGAGRDAPPAPQGRTESPAPSHALRVPEDFATLGEAIASAAAGETIRLGPGVYREQVELADLSLVGAGADASWIEPPPDAGPEATLVTVRGHVRISGVGVRDGGTGIEVAAGGRLDISDCQLIGNRQDGLAFDDDATTWLRMERCSVAWNGDGVDLDGTQGVILASRFAGNSDDGLDYDGDSGVLVHGCEFLHNGDDGIEIRLEQRTHAVVLASRFEGNREDGVEVIDSPLPDGHDNLIAVQDGHFRGNGRFGVGFVPHAPPEEHTGAVVQASVYGTGNRFEASRAGDVSANYAPLFGAAEDYPSSVRAVVSRDGAERGVDLDVAIPLLVGIYDLRRTPEGGRARDVEGVAVASERVFVADDRSRQIHVLDRRSAALRASVPSYADRASSKQGPHYEGLSLSPPDRLLAVDDDAGVLEARSLTADSLGDVVESRKTAALAGAEGIAAREGKLLVASGGNALRIVDLEGLAPAGPVSRLELPDFGGHVAGVAPHPAGGWLASVSAYVKGQERRNHASGYLELDAELGTVRRLWHLGPFSNDPRGIAVADGLVYVADGRADFVDADSGEHNRGGTKVFVFLPGGSADKLAARAELLPWWRVLPEDEAEGGP